MISEGLDPSHEKQAHKCARRERTANTFQAIASEWFAHKARTWTPRYLADQKARIEGKVYPAIGQRPLSEIKPLEMLNCLRDIERAGRLETLRKTRQICVQFFTYAIVTGRATSNPADYLNTALLSPQRGSNRCLTAEQLPAFMSDVLHSAHPMAKATRLLMLSGLRTGELLVELKALADRTGSPYILPSANRADRPRGRRCINDFLSLTGWHEHTTAHGFRHTFSTLAHDAGFNSAWIELQLAHVDKNSIRGTYNHALYLDDRRTMMQWYADTGAFPV